MSAAARLAALGAAGVLTASLALPVAGAIPPPIVPPNPPMPADPPPFADPPLERDTNRACVLPGVLPVPPVGDVPRANALLALSQAHTLSTGAGVKVAVIDTGVVAHPRLRVEGLGDYVDVAGDGVGEDCDMHATLVAGVIAGEPAPGDRFVGVAPGATLLSIRQTSQMWRAQYTGAPDPRAAEQAGQINALAAAIVKAANAGARVINVSVVACLGAAHPIDLTALGIAVWYAHTIKDALVVAAAGNVGGGDANCAANPDTDPLTPADPRNWDHVVAVSLPSVFADYVLSVGAVDDAGAAPDKDTAARFSMPGPWVSLAAPGTNIISIGPDGRLVNALPARDGLTQIFGTSYAAAYVSGTAALVRSRFPALTATEVRCRLIQTAHAGPRGVDNATGYGLVDPVAALTYDLPADCPASVLPQTHKDTLVITPPPPDPDPRPHTWALAMSGAVLAATMLGLTVLRFLRRTR